tara:strand:- start:339 stop:587 length:249 start_codon:yes stop_codon:yes gene_type:complete
MKIYNLLIEIFTSMKNLVVSTIFNFCLFVLLMVGIQNSSNKRKVNLLINETVNLPISFIIGSSFILGSLTGSFLSSNLLSED